MMGCMDTKTSSNYLSTAALRHRWGFHAESIRRIIRQRRLPSVRIGNRLLVAESDVEAFEHKHRIPSIEEVAT